MVHKSILWKYFALSDPPTYYKNNRTHRSAWCIGCLNVKMMRAREHDISDARYGAHAAVRSEAELQKLGA